MEWQNLNPHFKVLCVLLRQNLETKDNWTQISGMILKLMKQKTCLSCHHRKFDNFFFVQNDENVEWKFARAQLYMDYIMEGSTLPPPLNIIPSPKSIFRMFNPLYYCIRYVAGVFSRAPGQGLSDQGSHSVWKSWNLRETFSSENWDSQRKIFETNENLKMQLSLLAVIFVSSWKTLPWVIHSVCRKQHNHLFVLSSWAVLPREEYSSACIIQNFFPRHFLCVV